MTRTDIIQLIVSIIIKSKISHRWPLINLNNLQLQNNQIKDMTPLLNNDSLSKGDKVDLSNNPLNPSCTCWDIPNLKSNGVEVPY